MLRLFQRFVPLPLHYHGKRFFVRAAGRLVATAPHLSQARARGGEAGAAPIK